MDSLITTNNLPEKSRIVPTWIVGRFAVTGARSEFMRIAGKMFNKMSAFAYKERLNALLVNYQCSNPEIDMIGEQAIYWELFVKGRMSDDTAGLLGELLEPEPYSYEWGHKIVVGCTFEPQTFYIYRFSWRVPPIMIDQFSLPVGGECIEYWRELRLNGVNLNYYETLATYGKF